MTMFFHRLLYQTFIEPGLSMRGLVFEMFINVTQGNIIPFFVVEKFSLYKKTRGIELRV